MLHASVFLGGYFLLKVREKAEMTVNVIGTGSSGNLYEIIDEDGNILLIEAGLDVEKYIKHKIGTKTPEIMVISHEHSDHAQYRNHWASVMRVEFMPEVLDTAHWKVRGFFVKHGDCPCHAFIIQSEVERKKVLFATDFEYDDDHINALIDVCRDYSVKNYLIECNYNDYLYHLATDEQRRGCDRHFSDNDVVKFIREVGVTTPKIILIHGSNRLCADTYTKQYLTGKLPTASVGIAVGVKQNTKNLFKL